MLNCSCKNSDDTLVFEKSVQLDTSAANHRSQTPCMQYLRGLFFPSFTAQPAPRKQNVKTLRSIVYILRMYVNRSVHTGVTDASKKHDSDSSKMLGGVRCCLTNPHLAYLASTTSNKSPAFPRSSCTAFQSKDDPINMVTVESRLPLVRLAFRLHSKSHSCTALQPANPRPIIG